jgi:hypothetical protein
MERFPTKYMGWDEQKEWIRWETGTVVVAETQNEKKELRLAAEQIGVTIEELDYQGNRIAVSLTPSGLTKLDKALKDPKTTEQELQNQRVFDKFLSLMTP